jgi:hypothetical protein
MAQSTGIARRWHPARARVMFSSCHTRDRHAAAPRGGTSPAGSRKTPHASAMWRGSCSCGTLRRCAGLTHRGAVALPSPPNTHGESAARELPMFRARKAWPSASRGRPFATPQPRHPRRLLVFYARGHAARCVERRPGSVRPAGDCAPPSLAYGGGRRRGHPRRGSGASATPINYLPATPRVTLAVSPVSRRGVHS